jgi:butyrate kinase
VPAGIFVINPGATSTKIALFDGDREVWRSTVRHDADDLGGFGSVAGQLDYRFDLIHVELKDAPSLDLAAVVGRGGLLKPIEGGVYRVGPAMLGDVSRAAFGEHASNLGSMLANKFAEEYDVPAFVVDPVTTDEFPPIARVSGVPGIERKCRSHALNIKAVAHRTAKQMSKSIHETKFVVAHLGGGISIAALEGGRIVDVNDGLLGMGPFSPERAGGLPLQGVMDFVRDKGYDETKQIFSRESGFKGYFGTSSLEDVETLISEGNEEAKLIFEAMIYQIAKEIGAMTAVLSGKLDGILITGGLANSATFVAMLRDRIEAFADIFILPGEEEMLALAEGALRVLQGEEEPKEYGDTA